MASIRIGFSSDFVLKNGVVGLGTTVGSTTDGKLELDNGTLRANLSVTGVATLTAYGGFVAQKQHVNKPAAIGFGTVGLQTAGVGTAYQYYETETGFTDLGGVHHGDDQYFNTLSEDLVIDDGQILNITNTEMVGRTTIGEYDPHNHSSYVCAGSLEQVSVTGHFSVPNGGTNDRQLTPIEGTVRFNTDLNTLEFFNGNEWRQFTYNQGQSGRAVFGGGNYAPGESSTYDYLIMTTLGNTVNFGEITLARANPGACGDGVRAIFAGGEAPGANDTIDYNSIPSGGVGADFGNLTSNFRYMAGCSSSTRGIFFSGSTPSASDAIEYIQIQTTGNSLDFGNLIGNGILNHGACSSPVRGISMDAQVGGDQQIQYVTIASKGNALSFGSGLSAVGSGNGDASRSCSNEITGLSAGVGATNIIAYITMATTGNALDFGDLTRGRYGIGATASKIRGIFNSGWSPSISPDSVIDYVTFASKGNAIDFGDNGDPRRELGATSDSHGGLGGF